MISKILFSMSFPLVGNPSLILIQKDSGQARMTDSTPRSSGAVLFITWQETMVQCMMTAKFT